MASKNDFFAGLQLKGKDPPACTRQRSASNPNSLLAKPPTDNVFRTLMNGRTALRAPYSLPARPALVSPKLQQLRSIRNRISSKQMQNIVYLRRLVGDSQSKSASGPSTRSAIDALKLEPAKSEKQLRDKQTRMIKQLSKLEFSSLLFRRVYYRMGCLSSSARYEQIQEYEKHCNTSDRSAVRQSVMKAQLLRRKTARGRGRVLRVNENGMEDLPTGEASYVHVYTFNRRQRARRYRDIVRGFGLHWRLLKMVYGHMQITLPKLLVCPSCNETIDADAGHCCATPRKPRRRRGVSLLCKAPAKQSNLLQSPSSTGDRRKITDHHSGGQTEPEPSTSGTQVKSTTMMKISQDRTEYLDFSAEHFASGKTGDLFIEQDGREDISIIKMEPVNEDEYELSSKRSRICPTLLLDSSNVKEAGSIIVKRLSMDQCEDLPCMKAEAEEELKSDKVHLRRIRATSPCAARVQTKSIILPLDNYLSLDNGIQVSYE